jgi:hypothetical protein
MEWERDALCSALLHLKQAEEATRVTEGAAQDTIYGELLRTPLRGAQGLVFGLYDSLKVKALRPHAKCFHGELFAFSIF